MNPQKNNHSDPFVQGLRAGDCPGTDLLESYRMHPETAASVVKSHLASCPACQAELELLVSFQMATETAQESTDVDWIVARAKVPSAPSTVRSWWNSLFTAGSYRGWASALAMAVFAIAVGIQWNASSSRLPDLPKDISDSPMRAAGRIEVLVPAVGSGTIAAAPEEIRWKAVAGTQQYEVALIEVDGTEVQVGSTDGTSQKLSDVSRKLFLPHKTVGIRIRARAADGRILAESQEIRIRVEP